MDLASRPTSQLHHTVDEHEMLSEGDGTRPVYKAGSVMLGGGGLRWDGIGEASGCPPRRRACLFCCRQDKTSEAVLLVLLMEINGSMLNSSGSQVHVATNPVLRPRH